MEPTYTSILTPEDAKAFIKSVNDLHDGEITAIDYRFNGITKLPEGGHMYEPDKSELRITVLVTSIWDSVVELVFEALYDWQLKSNQMGIYGTLVEWGDQGSVIWTTAHSTDMTCMKESSYIVCHGMKWRFIEDNRPGKYK